MKIFLVIFLFALIARAEDEPVKEFARGSAFAAYIENDAHVLGGPGSDRAYSNGFKFSYIYAQDKSPDWSKKPVHFLKFLNDEFQQAKSNFSISFAQQIYTPSNIHSSDQISNDRPYAAWLYFGLGLNFKEKEVAHYFELDVGTVGPSALGEQVQNDFHSLIGDPHANGWAYGIKDEPTLELTYQERFKYLNSRYFDFIPYYGAAFGNVQVGAHFGGLVRLGFNLPDDFGPARPSAGDGDSFVNPTGPNDEHKNSIYLFAGFRGTLLARNIFLDGNTFRASPHVTKYPFNSDTEVGAGLQFHPVNIVWSFVVRSPEFEQQSNFNSFASVNLIYSF